MLAVGVADTAVDAVGGDHQVVGAGQVGGGRGLLSEAEVDAEGAAALVEEFEETVPAEGGEAVAAGGEGAAAVDDVDVLPAHHLPAEGGGDLGVGALDAAEGLVGEHDAETEGVVGGVALPEGDPALGVEAFEQRGGVEAAGAAADDGDPRGSGHRPCHLGGRFSVKAAWNSA